MHVKKNDLSGSNLVLTLFPLPTPRVTMQSPLTPSFLLLKGYPRPLTASCQYQSSHRPPTAQCVHAHEHIDSCYLAAIGPSGLKVPPRLPITMQVIRRGGSQKQRYKRLIKHQVVSRLIISGTVSLTLMYISRSQSYRLFGSKLEGCQFDLSAVRVSRILS